MDHAIISENRIVPIADENMPLKEAALLGCAVPTGAGAVLNNFSKAVGKIIVCYGVGGVGLSALLAASTQAQMLIAVDVSDEKLKEDKLRCYPRYQCKDQSKPRYTITFKWHWSGLGIWLQAQSVLWRPHLELSRTWRLVYRCGESTHG